VTGKKKATGMSRRQSFLDPAVIAENKLIMRFNREAEAAARGETLPPEAERGPRRTGRDGRPVRGARPTRDSTPARGPQRGRPPGADRSAADGSPRAPRAPRVSAEDEARLRDAVLTAAGETGLDAAGRAAVDELVAHGGFDKATSAGWVIAVGERPDERAPEEWELLRAAWSRIRIALLEVWVVSHPSAQSILDRERKEVLRAEKARQNPRPPARTRTQARRRPRPERSSPHPAPVREPASSGLPEAPAGGLVPETDSATHAGADSAGDVAQAGVGLPDTSVVVSDAVPSEAAAALAELTPTDPASTPVVAPADVEAEAQGVPVVDASIEVERAEPAALAVDGAVPAPEVAEARTPEAATASGAGPAPVPEGGTIETEVLPAEVAPAEVTTTESAQVPEGSAEADVSAEVERSAAPATGTLESPSAIESPAVVEHVASPKGSEAPETRVTPATPSTPATPPTGVQPLAQHPHASSDHVQASDEAPKAPDEAPGAPDENGARTAAAQPEYHSAAD
jgi:hypothetical protein